MFLDIDGVVHPLNEKHFPAGSAMEAIFARSELEDKERENPDFVMPILDVECRPELMARVKRIVDATGCEVVLSSTWRQEEPSWKAALGRFRETGIEIAGRIGGDRKSVV